jgi:hypothetical protein
MVICCQSIKGGDYSLVGLGGANVGKAGFERFNEI